MSYLQFRYEVQIKVPWPQHLHVNTLFLSLLTEYLHWTVQQSPGCSPEMLSGLKEETETSSQHSSLLLHSVHWHVRQIIKYMINARGNNATQCNITVQFVLLPTGSWVHIWVAWLCEIQSSFFAPFLANKAEVNSVTWRIVARGFRATTKGSLLALKKATWLAAGDVRLAPLLSPRLGRTGTCKSINTGHRCEWSDKTTNSNGFRLFWTAGPWSSYLHRS